MRDLFGTYTAMHNGISYSVVVIFGTFIFMAINTLLAYSGRVSGIMRKLSFFSMALLYIQALMAIMMAFTSPDYKGFSDTDLYQHFRYSVVILSVAGLMTIVHRFLVKNEVMPLRILIIALISALLFESVYPWRIIFGEM